MSRLWSEKIFLLGTLLALAGCGGGDGGNEIIAPADGTDQVVLTLRHIGDPAPYHYALWAAGAADTTLLLRFSTREGAPVDLSGAAIPSLDQEEALGAKERFLVTLETDTAGVAPAEHPFLAGPIAGDAAVLTLADPSAIGVDLTGAAGTFLFATPTTADTTDCGRGIWWTDGSAASLVLPLLPSGWKYEGWVVDRDAKSLYSTGRFSGPTGADSDGAGATAGPGAAFAFPGEDFTTAAGGVPILDLDDGSFRVSISVEPDPDLSDDPFLTILEKIVASGGLTFHAQDLPPLSGGPFYELWAAFSDTLISLARFEYVNQKLIDLGTGEEIEAFPIGCNILDAASLLLSIEPEGDTDPLPSGTFLLAGAIDGDSAALRGADPLALGDTYEQEGAGYILDTPSSEVVGDSSRGIWFYQAAGGATTSTLPIPDAPDGWKYEVWIVDLASHDSTSIGTFAALDSADSDGPGPYADTVATPAFPGQDFVSGTVINLADGNHAVVLSIEPETDWAPETPFLILFEDLSIASGIPRDSTQALSAVTNERPDGAVAFATSKELAMTSSGALPEIEVRFGRE